ncbi:hypothetical protein DFP72DRAFT_1040325 [Ephemerocybe angulata]|uniref:C2H2-type domain-containing protein n=1 Tax=Ephemerocybe angulata TaxID=980116 RepID=A0A8H6IHN5_9AGAR|nr:hypothetical protein DFP72DRAFT_1040325 [Tulosesus angulatus]
MSRVPALSMGFPLSFSQIGSSRCLRKCGSIDHPTDVVPFTIDWGRWVLNGHKGFLLTKDEVDEGRAVGDGDGDGTGRAAFDVSQKIWTHKICTGMKAEPLPLPVAYVDRWGCKTIRVSFINLLTALRALASLATAYRDDVGVPLAHKDNKFSHSIHPYSQYTFAARDNLGELTTSMRSLDRREMLADIATRDLLDELADRLEARGLGGPIKCSFCSKKFPGTADGPHKLGV